MPRNEASPAAPAFSLCVFCGSRPGLEPAQLQAAEQTGRWIAEQGAQLVYGGGHNGLMGRVADACLEARGRVVGFIPQALVGLESAHERCTELYVVDTMHQRKQGMANRSDAFLVLPGGIGTFEEFFEVWTWKQLGYHRKPIALLNLNGYYDGLLSFIDTCVAQRFMDHRQTALIRVGTDLPTLLGQLKGEILAQRQSGGGTDARTQLGMAQV